MHSPPMKRRIIKYQLYGSGSCPLLQFNFSTLCQTKDVDAAYAWSEENARCSEKHRLFSNIIAVMIR